jgi:uncharacterized repeat protein (TIGR01451 family)
MMSRGALGLASPRTRRGLALTWAVLFTLSLLLQYATFAFAPAALAVHDEGLFELDGNTIAGDAAAPIGPADDWDSHPGSTGSAFIFKTDPLSQTTDDIFTGGGSKDQQPIANWSWKTGSVPDKDNIEHAFAAAYQKAGHTFVYYGLDRYANNGDAFTGFWFFKGKVGPVAGGSFSGSHQVGDLLVLSNFTNGGSTATIQLFEWVGSGGSDGSLNLVADGKKCTDAPAVDKACAVTNDDPVNPSWSFDDKGTAGADNPIPADSFFEGGIDLDELFDGNAPCFSSFFAETRSSQAVTATLKDFSGGSFNTCVPPTITTKVSDSSIDQGGSITDTATLTGTDGPASGTVDFFVCGPADAATACASGGTKVGDSVAVDTNADGGTATSGAFAPTAAGWYCFRAVYTPDADSQYLKGSHTNATSECVQVHGAGIAITKTANPQGPVSAGDDIGFDITVMSTGDGTAVDVTATDALPGDGWTVGDPTGATTGVACAIDAGTLTCTDASMASGDSFTVHVSRSTTAADCGTIENQASVSAGNDGSGDASATVDVVCPDIAVVKSAETGVIKVGDDAVFTISVSNVGAGDAHDVVVTDELPGGLDWSVDNAACSISGATLTCDLGDLAAGSDPVVITVTANTDTPASESDDCGLLDNTASAVSSNEPSDALANNSSSASITVTCSSALVIDKSLGDTGATDPDLGVPAADIGDTLHYSLKYSGAGPLTNAVITDVLPQGLAYVDGTAAGNTDFNDGTYDSATRTITWEAKGVLPDPAKGTVTYDATVLSTAPDFAQPLVNTATIDSDETTPDSDTASVAVLAPPEEATATPPATSTILPEAAPSNPGFALMLILLGVAGLAIAIGFLTPTPERVRRRDRLG